VGQPSDPIEGQAMVIKIVYRLNFKAKFQTAFPDGCFEMFSGLKVALAAQ
jgi:hypothetical protein